MREHKGQIQEKGMNLLEFWEIEDDIDNMFTGLFESFRS